MGNFTILLHKVNISCCCHSLFASLFRFALSSQLVATSHCASRCIRLSCLQPNTVCALQLVHLAKFLSFSAVFFQVVLGLPLSFLARYNSRYVTERSLTDAKSMSWIRFASNLFATTVLQTAAKRCYTPSDHFFLNLQLKPMVH